MKKLIATTVIVFSAFSASASDECESSTMLQRGAIGAAIGSGAALIIPGFGPVIATGIVAGSFVTTTNVAVCAYKESQETDKDKTMKQVKKLYKETTKTAEVIYKDLSSKVDSIDIKEKKDKAVEAFDNFIKSFSKKDSV